MVYGLPTSHIRGQNPTLLNVKYIRPNKKAGIEEVFEVIYKTEGGDVHLAYEPAMADIYIVKPENRIVQYTKPQEHVDLMDKRRVKINDIKYEIAKAMGPQGQNFLKYVHETRDYKRLKELYLWPYAFGCDFQEEFYFMKDWYSKYKLGSVKLSKAFLDIEIDMIDATVDLDKIPDTAHAPVNCVTVILEDSSESFTFILKPQPPSKLMYSDPDKYQKRYSLYQHQLSQYQYLMNNRDKFIQECKNDFDPTYGNLTYHILGFDEEIDLIRAVFDLINKSKVNFCLIWNMRFDIQYLLERIRILGYDPRTIMCHPDFKNPKAWFHVDRMMFNLEKQYDYFTCSSYTQFICQMRLYASIRKSQQMLKSVALNAIGDRELRDRKVDYPAETNFRDFPYVDFWRFVKYNIKDVLIQKGIEQKVNDVMYYYYKSHSNLTPYNKIFRETHLLRNVREMYFNQDGWIQSNNTNIIKMSDEDIKFYELQTDDDDENESTFKGAIMADPVLNMYVGMLIHGERSNVLHKNAMDYDMAGFYPSIKIASNMDSSTLLFKAEFQNEQFISGECKNRSLNQVYQERDKHGKIRNIDITGEAISTLVSNNTQTFCHSYLALPDVVELQRDLNYLLAA